MSSRNRPTAGRVHALRPGAKNQVLRETSLVLLPGLLCDAAMWEPQIAALGDREKGHVASFFVADLTTQSSMQEMAASVLRDAPFERFALAGLSMGGYVAQEIMRQAPQRVMRLALLDTRARPELPEETVRRRALMELAQTGKGFTPVTNRMLPLMLHPSRVREQPLVGVIRDMANRVGLEAYLRQQEAVIARPDFRPSLATINCPTLVLCGREDQLTPLENSEEMAATIPGAKLVVVEECGHMSTLERPEQVNRELQKWLAA